MPWPVPFSKAVRDFCCEVIIKEAEEQHLKVVAEEVGELVFWGITFARGEKKVRLHAKEKQ